MGSVFNPVTLKMLARPYPIYLMAIYKSISSWISTFPGGGGWVGVGGIIQVQG